MQRNQQSCPHYLWSQLQMVHLETLPDLKRQRLWNNKNNKGRSSFNSKLMDGSTCWKKETVPGSGIEGPVLGGGGRLGGGGLRGGPAPPACFFYRSVLNSMPACRRRWSGHLGRQCWSWWIVVTRSRSKSWRGHPAWLSPRTLLNQFLFAVSHFLVNEI